MGGVGQRPAAEKVRLAALLIGLLATAGGFIGVVVWLGAWMNDPWGVYAVVLIDYLKAPSRYPRHTFHGDGPLDPVNVGDLNGVLGRVSHFVERLRLPKFCLRTENWSGPVVVYAMDDPEPRGRLREALEADGFTVTERRDEYGTSREVHPRQVVLITTRYDLIVEVLPEARDIAGLKAGVAQRLSHPVPIGLLHGTIQVFDISS